MAMSQEQSKALDLVLEASGDLVDIAKLELGLASGAIVLYVHAMSEWKDNVALIVSLTIAAIFFGVSCLYCIRGLAKWTSIKTSIAKALIAEPTPSVKPGDQWLTANVSNLGGAKSEFDRMEAFFNLGVIAS